MNWLPMCTALVPLLIAPLAQADEEKEEHFDVWMQFNGLGLTTGSITEGEPGDPINCDERVFGAEFGEDPGFPFAAFEPGLQAIDGEFDPFTMLTFDITDAVTRWNGAGFEATDETITLEFGPASVTSGAGMVNGFEFGMDDEGGFHGHFDIVLNGLGGDPNPGIYLLPLALDFATPGPDTASDTFWFVMNLGMAEEAHEAAEDWVRENLIPVSEEKHYDVWMQYDGTKITTGSITEGEPGDPITCDERVYGAEFGEDPGFPFSAFEPGFQAIDGEFAPFTMLTFDITDAVTRWNGAGFEDTDETITLEFGPANVTSGVGVVNGFDFGMDDEGGFHGHFDLTLNGSGGDPNTGIYLLPLSLDLAAPGPDSASNTFWFVMNLGMDEEDHEAAEDWVRENLVPDACTADLNGDGDVGPADLAQLLDNWGTDAADLNGDGTTGPADLALLLDNWGACEG